MLKTVVKRTFWGGATKEKERANTKERKAKRVTKEKVTGATVNINRATTPHNLKEKERKLDKERPSKDNNSTKEKESHMASRQDKEKDP